MTKPEAPFVTITDLSEHSEVAEALGNFAVAWSHAEKTTYFAFWVSSGTNQDQAHNIYQAFTGFHAKAEVTKRLLEGVVDRKTELQDVLFSINKFIEISKFRNDIMHRTWVRSSNGVLCLLDSRIRKQTPKAQVISAEEIRDQTKAIQLGAARLIGALKCAFPEAFSEKN